MGRRDSDSDDTVPCPHCGQVNQLSFDPSGAVHAVRPYVNPWPAPAPSVN